MAPMAEAKPEPREPLGLAALLDTPEHTRHAEMAATVYPKGGLGVLKLKRDAGVNWLVEHTLAAEWPKAEAAPAKKREPARAPEPEPQGKPTLKYIAEQARKANPEPKGVWEFVENVAPEEVKWLWPGRIPAGRVSMVMGRQGDGKSTLTSWLAAAVSSGKGWPDCYGHNTPGGVILLTAEESVAQDVRPRLDGFGFGKGRVQILKSVDRGQGRRRSFSLTEDVAILEQRVKECPDIRLVIVDPMGSYLKGITGYDTDVRELLQGVFDFADRTGVAVVLAAHPNKNSEKDVLDRVCGSSAFTQMVRMAWYLSRDPGDSARRMLSLMKGNIRGAVRSAISLHFNERTFAMRWDPSPVDLMADDVDSLLQSNRALARMIGNKNAEKGKTKAAEEFILERLKAGEVRLALLRDDAEYEAIKPDTFKLAMRRLCRDNGPVEKARTEDGKVVVCRLRAAAENLPLTD